jgi:hypothetical protein
MGNLNTALMSYTLAELITKNSVVGYEDLHSNV